MSQTLPTSLIADPNLVILSDAQFERIDSRFGWVVNGLLVRGEPIVVGGPAKSLKTSLMVDLSTSLASPLPNRFLGHFPVAPTRVLFFSAEPGMHSLAEKRRRIMAARGLGAHALTLTWCFGAPRLDRDSDLIVIDAQLQQSRAEIVIFDPLYLMLSGTAERSAANLYDVGPVLQRVTSVCLERGATPIFVHHFNRPGAVSCKPATLENLAFAGIGEFARQWLLINRRAKFEPRSGEHKLWLSVGSSAGQSCLYHLDIDEGRAGVNLGQRSWHVRARMPQEERAAGGRNTAERVSQKELTQIANQISDHLMLFPGGATLEEIQAAVQASENACLAALDQLVRKARISRMSRRRNGRMIDLYSGLVV